MKNFEKITETPETLAAFLAALTVANGPWDQEFHAQYCADCLYLGCDSCPHSAQRNNPLWWLGQRAEDAPGKMAGTDTTTVAEPERDAESAAPESESGAASATAAWKVMQVLGYVNERPFEETQDLLKRTLEILRTLEGAGVSPEYWASVIGMAATFDVHMRGGQSQEDAENAPDFEFSVEDVEAIEKVAQAEPAHGFPLMVIPDENTGALAIEKDGVTLKLGGREAAILAQIILGRTRELK